MGENDPKPEYGAKDSILVFKATKCAIYWPIPWDVCDFGHVHQFAYPEELHNVRDFRVVGHRLQLKYRGLLVWIRAVSDLAVSLWSVNVRRGWLSYLAEAKAMYAEVAELVVALSTSGSAGTPLQQVPPLSYSTCPSPLSRGTIWPGTILALPAWLTLGGL